jgi:hypothetical protein
MSGWDTSSRPTWGQPDGPEDPQAHPDQDLSAGAGKPWDRLALPPAGSQQADPSWDGPQANGAANGNGGYGDTPNGAAGSTEETAAGYPRRTPGRTLSQHGFGQPAFAQPPSALPSRGQLGAGQQGFGQQGQASPGFGQPDLPRREGRGRHSSVGPEGLSQDGAGRELAGRDGGGAAPQGTAPWEVPQERPGTPLWAGAPNHAGADNWAQPAQPAQPSAENWAEPAAPGNDNWAEPARPAQGRQPAPWEEGTRDGGLGGPSRPDFTAPAPGARRLDGEPDLRRPDFDALGLPVRDNGARMEPAQLDPALQEFYGASPSRQESARQESAWPGSPRPDGFRGDSARQDSARQDSARPDGYRAEDTRFDGYRSDGFRPPAAPQGAPGYPDQGPRRVPGQQPRGGPGAPGSPEDWATPGRASRTAGSETGPSRAIRETGSFLRTTGTIRALRGNEEGFSKRVYLTVGGLLLLIVAVVYILMHQHAGGGTPKVASSTLAPGQIPSGSPSTSKATTPAGKTGKTAKTAKTAAGFVLSVPATAGGYPKGADPHFLATAAGTARQVLAGVRSGGAGTPKGSPLSAAYQLPSGSQVITFVGYKGTFNPAKIATILGSFGTDQNTYPAGPHGGAFGCFNSTPTASVTSGAVCVWATKTTLGVTEFFSATGPEALTASQEKGAADTLKLRASVEKKP